MNITLYLSDKPREYNIGNALKAGFVKRGEKVSIVRTQDYREPEPGSHLAVVIGIKGVSKHVMEDCTRSARHCLLVDKSYFGRTEYLRLSLDGFQPYYMHARPRPHDRWKKIAREFHLELKPRQTTGSNVIFAGSSQKYCDWHDLGNVSDYAERVCKRILKTTHGRLPLLYRPKPSWIEGHAEDVREVPGTVFSGLDVKLKNLLPDCHAVVTHGSNAAVEAVMAGVPAVVISRGTCAAEPVAGNDYEALNAPTFPDDESRLQWLADLAYCQFDIDEMASGLAWDILAPQTMKEVTQMNAGADDLDAVVKQYRVMHQNPKRFRGGSIKGHIEEIGALVAKHGAKTLLDYGCGKGLQYSEWKLHERWGVAPPTCYDPGVPGLDVKPRGTFAGAICTDVMEHIPEPHVPDVLREIIGYAERFAYFCIFTKPSRKFLPDGRNAHVTVHEPDWWLDTICQAVDGVRAGEYGETKAHHVIKAKSGVDVVVTFRGGD